MEISILLIEQICSLVLMGLSGYWLRRSGIMGHEASMGLTVACVYVCMPCTLFESFQTDITSERLAGFLYAVLAVAAIQAVFFLVMGIVKRIFSFSAIESTSIIYSNAGNLIIPLVTGVFGPEYIFYTGAYLFVQNALLWSHAQMRIGGTKQASWKKIFLHPCILSIFAGMFFLVMRWSLPSVADTAFVSMSACIGPLSMLTIGILIAEIDLKGMFVNRRIYMVAVFRLLIYPLLAIGTAFCIWKLFPAQVNPVVYLIVVMGACGPAATSLTQMAQMFDNDPGYASSINVLTTFGSIVTMPLMMTAAQLIL